MPTAPDTPRVPGEAEPPDEVIAVLRATCEGLRTANVRLRELLAEKDEIIAALQVQVAQVAELEARVEALRQRVLGGEPAQVIGLAVVPLAAHPPSAQAAEHDATQCNSCAAYGAPVLGLAATPGLTPAAQEAYDRLLEQRRRGEPDAPFSPADAEAASRFPVPHSGDA